MINITSEQIDILKQEIPNIDELIQQNDINTLLFAIDEKIVSSFDENDESTEKSIILQKVYDQIYSNN